MGFRGVLGHEFLAERDDGTRVTSEINHACGSCPVCQAGEPHHCPNRTVLGILGHDGAMAERVAVPERNLHAIPDAIDDRRAIFIEPLAAAFRIVEQIRIEAGLPIAVVGDGKLGLLCAWALRASGARVTLVGKHPDKLALAGKGIEPVRLDEAGKLGRRFDVVADCTGSPTGLPTALGLVRPLGTVVLKTTIAGDYAINLAPIVIDEIRIVGSRCGPFPRAIAALASGEVDPAPLLGPEFPLERADEAFAVAARRGARKIAIRMD
jgi:threonine dehydrogenase-like Zn-dependent dehydrogenase